MATDQEIAQERLNLMNLMDNGEFRIPRRELDENLLLATWNIQQFTDNKSARALRYIADIVERFDILAIQELKRDLSGLAELQRRLPSDYQILVSDTTGNTERFAFVYDTRTVRATGLVSDVAFNVRAGDHEAFQAHRMPYMASFRVGRFDFIIVQVHIFQSNTVFRDREIAEVSTEIKKRSENAKNFDRDFFLVGDFNVATSAVFDPVGLTTLPNMDQIHTNFNRTQALDKIAWIERANAKQFLFENRANVVPFGDVLYRLPGDPSAAAEVSDHLPLWAEFRINVLTAQLNQIINR